MIWPSLDPGELRNQIIITQEVPSTDASGPSVTMQQFLPGAGQGNLYAKIAPFKGTDVIRSGQVVTQLYLVVTMWWQAGVLPNMQVQALNGNYVGTYVIQSVENDAEANIVLHLTCVALGRNDQ